MPPPPHPLLADLLRVPPPSPFASRPQTLPFAGRPITCATLPLYPCRTSCGPATRLWISAWGRWQAWQAMCWSWRMARACLSWPCPHRCARGGAEACSLPMPSCGVCCLVIFSCYVVELLPYPALGFRPVTGRAQGGGCPHPCDPCSTCASSSLLCACPPCSTPSPSAFLAPPLPPVPSPTALLHPSPLCLPHCLAHPSPLCLPHCLTPPLPPCACPIALLHPSPSACPTALLRPSTLCLPACLPRHPCRPTTPSRRTRGGRCCATVRPCCTHPLTHWSELEGGAYAAHWQSSSEKLLHRCGPV